MPPRLGLVRDGSSTGGGMAFRLSSTSEISRLGSTARRESHWSRHIRAPGGTLSVSVNRYSQKELWNAAEGGIPATVACLCRRVHFAKQCCFIALLDRRTGSPSSNCPRGYLLYLSQSFLRPFEAITAHKNLRPEWFTFRDPGVFETVAGGSGVRPSGARTLPPRRPRLVRLVRQDFSAP